MVKYLGIHITKDNGTSNNNIWNNLDKCKSLLNL